MLPGETFKELVKNGVLVALDLIIKNGNGEVLTGLRKNAPAKGFWFVPGGRVFKGETLKAALRRVLMEEAGINLDDVKKVRLQGIYDHIYEENFFGQEGFGTHYVVMAVELSVEGFQSVQSPQHESLKFMSVDEIMKSKAVHSYTKNYFIDSPDNFFLKCGL